jgi:hypothetical protein
MATQAQNHIHLDADLDGAPENGPTNKYTALVPETRSAVAHVALEWAVDGTLMAHKVTSAGDPVVSLGRRYRLKVTRTELDSLLADVGRQVYFVAHYHPDDFEDHTGQVQTVEFSRITEIRSREHATLATYYVTIELQIS